MAEYNLKLEECEKCLLNNKCTEYEKEESDIIIKHKIFKYRYCRKYTCINTALKQAELAYPIANIFTYSDYYKEYKYFTEIKQFIFNLDWITKGENLYLQSQGHGCGKTYNSCVIANHYIYTHAHLPGGITEYPLVYFVSFPYFIIDGRKNYYNKDNFDFANKLEYAMNTRLLILDDIGGIDVTEFSESLLYSIIDYRMLHKKSIIYTSDKLIESLKYSPRIKSRIYNNTGFININVEDIRESSFNKKYKGLINILKKGVGGR